MGGPGLACCWWARWSPGTSTGDLPNTEYGLGLAVENLVLQAVDLGLVTHQMGGFDKEAVRAAFGLPADVRPVVVVAVGAPGTAEDLPEDLRARERRPRERRPLSELVFTDQWGKPALPCDRTGQQTRHDEPEHRGKTVVEDDVEVVVAGLEQAREEQRQRLGQRRDELEERVGLVRTEHDHQNVEDLDESEQRANAADHP